MPLKQRLLQFRRVFTHPPFERALRALVRGAEYRGNLAKLIPPPELYREGVRKAVTTDGINFEVDNSCLMQWYVFWGLHDPTRDSLYSLVSEGDVVLDVGTNIGETLLNFARLVGPAGYVYGFEPDEINYANVQRNITLNTFENVHVFNLGVSDRAQTLCLYRVDQHNRGMNRVLANGQRPAGTDFTEIETDTLDHLVADNAIERVDLIKIDIEGYEMHALRGATEVLERFKPRLFIEVGYTRLIQNGTSPGELVSFLEDRGYTVRHSETDERITREYDFVPLGEGGIDVFAIHADEGQGSK